MCMLRWLAVPQEELESVAGEKEAWDSLPIRTAAKPPISGRKWMKMASFNAAAKANLLVIPLFDH